MLTHIKCRGGKYPFSQISRLPIPDDLVPWSKVWDCYQPQYYDSDVLKGKPWSDLSQTDPNFKPKWNSLDGLVNRKSHFCDYCIDKGMPLNPIGRTGLRGRGVLGRWGPNHAADPVVTRWKRTVSNYVIKHDSSQKPILQFCAIKRKDNGQWAIPGGMVDLNEKISATLKREFMEEALNFLEASNDKKKEMENLIRYFFENGTEIYRGYVDDPRNTDNAWMETVVFNFHDDNGEAAGKFPLHAGDDAASVKWIDLNCNLDLYASHSNFVQTICLKLGAHW